LCPNCHLTDQHNPTARLEPARLLLFRTHKDPAILRPQFVPLFARLRFLDGITDTADASELSEQSEELCRFVAVLNMGAFYGKEVEMLVKPPRHAYSIRLDGRPDPAFEDASRRHYHEYREQLRAVRDRVYHLIVELLRYQSW
jgi:hypothetical protein